MLIRVAHEIVLAWGWKRRIVAFCAGAIGALALAPFDIFPAMLAPMMVAVWLIDGSGRAAEGDGRGNRLFAAAFDAAGAGWWLGFGYFLAGFWWLGAAFLVEADKFLWALPFAVGGFPAVLALFPAAGFALARLLWSSGPARILALAAALGAAEWARGVVLTGFPWNAWGMALGGNQLLGQIASLVGLHGLSFLTIAIFAAPALLAQDTKKEAAPGLRRLASPVGLALIAFVAIAGFGALRLSAGVVAFEPAVRLRIMQPNLPQDEKFRPERKEQILARYLALSDRATSPQRTGVADVTHLIWPESPFPFILSRDAASLARIGGMLRDSTILITGAARLEGTPGGSRLPGESSVVYFNSIHVIGKGGAILDTYDKAHLVPFGEYLPFTRLLERLRLRQMVHIPGGFESAVYRKALAAPGLPPMAALICYEASFPGEVMPNDGRSERPGFMLNVTNDGWFGLTTGPYQHLAQARLRTIEEGLPLVRAANTGVSAVVDPYGRIIARLALGEEGVLDADLPKKIDPTVFSRFPLVGPALLLALLLFGALLGKMRN